MWSYRTWIVIQFGFTLTFPSFSSTVFPAWLLPPLKSGCWISERRFVPWVKRPCIPSVPKCCFKDWLRIIVKVLRKSLSSQPTWKCYKREASGLPKENKGKNNQTFCIDYTLRFYILISYNFISEPFSVQEMRFLNFLTTVCYNYTIICTQCTDYEE